MKLRTLFMAATLSSIATIASAEPAVFTSATSELRIPEVVVEGQTYTNAILKHEGDYVFRLLSIEEGSATVQCTGEHINFTQYAKLPGVPFFTPITEEQMNNIIGCTGVVTNRETSTPIMRWSLASSTEACPRYIQLDLSVNSEGQLTPSGVAILGINSETNEPRPCS